MSPHRSPHPLIATLAALGAGFHEVPADELARDPDGPPPIDYTPLVALGRAASRWMLDTLRTQTTDPTDREAIDRTRAAVDAADCGAAPRIDEHDLLTVLGLAITTFERALNVEGLAQVMGAVYADGAAVVSHVVRLIARPGRPTRPIPIPVAVRRRPCVAHGADPDLPADGPCAVLTFR